MEPRTHLKPGTLIKLKWEDSSYKPGWHYPDDFGVYTSLPRPRILKPEGAGVVVEATEEALVVSLCKTNEGGVIHPTAIPWGNIIALTEI